MDLDIVDDLKRPEYTGENRCEPCTILNLAIAAVVGSLIARKSRLGGALAIGLSIALIYLRGYLVPGTPTLTKRYLPPAVLEWFGKEPEPKLASGFGGVDTASRDDAHGRESTGTEPVAGTEDGADDASMVEAPAETASHDDSEATDEREPLDLEAYFLEHNVLEPCADRDDLCLTDEFERAWLEGIESLNESGIDAGDAADAFGFDIDPEDFELESRDDAQLLRSDQGVAGRWPSRAALIADVAASDVLETWTPGWNAQESETKGQVCNGLRMFLETCPSGGAVSMDEEVVESCCSSHDVVAVTCEETGERLFEQRLDAVGA